jgi:hypothetical protein
MVRVEEGIANFRKFQLDASRKLGFVYGATWLAGIIATILLAIIAWALTQVIPAGKLIMDDYYREHPASLSQKKACDDRRQMAVSSQQNAGSEPRY